MMSLKKWIKLLRESVQLKLTLALAVLSLFTAAAAGATAFYLAYQTGKTMQDGMLQQIAAHTDPRQVPPSVPDGENDEHVYVQTEAGVSDGPFLLLPRQTPDGFSTVWDDENESWRVFVRNTPQGRVIAMQENEFREDAALRAAWGGALPVLLLIPLVSLLSVWILWRTMKPVRELSAAVAQREDNDLSPLSGEGVPSEIQGFVSAINCLLQRTGKAVRQQQRFIADAAHEMRSPMTALSLQAERFAALDLPPEARAQAAVLQENIGRNRRLLEQMLSLARAQADGSGRLKTALTAQGLFRRLLEDLWTAADSKAQDFGVADSTDAAFYADETELYTLLKTLAENALHYTPEHGQIDLSVCETADKIIFRIEDNGSGIPPVERSRVLEPFYRIAGSGKEGTGLGLSIADTVARRYGGRIVLRDSTAFAHGLLAEAELDKAFLQP